MCNPEKEGKVVRIYVAKNIYQKVVLMEVMVVVEAILF
jgi:hypothetical protein